MIFALYNQADTYFSTEHRVIRPLGGVTKNIQPNYLLNLFSNEQLEAMKAEVAYLCYVAVENRFAKQATTHKTMYIHPMLFKIPAPIGDRSDNIQDGYVIEAMLKKMESKISIGQLLQIKAGAQKLQLVETPAADEVYDIIWARNTAAVTQLLID